MPAAAVIPAPIAYIKVVAVKKLVVEFLAVLFCPRIEKHCHRPENLRRPSVVAGGIWHFTLKKSECSKQAIAMNRQAWNNGIGLVSILLVIGY